MDRILWLLTCSVGLLLPLQDAARAQTEATRPRIGLVLSGGGARGITHIGVLKVLEELHVPIDCIAGTSMGAIVGGLYAYGLSPAELEKLVKSTDWDFLLSDKPQRDDELFRRKQDELHNLVDLNLGFRDGKFRLPLGLGHASKAALLFSLETIDAHNLRSFDDLRIPYRAVATNIANGHEVVLDKGSLSRAMSASMAVPGVFAPVEINGKQLVDGGIVNNLPVDVARRMGADIVIVVDISSPLLTPDEITSVLSVSMQMVSILMQRNVDEQLASIKPGDVLIRPELGDISSTDFNRGAEAIDIGEKAARAHAEVLRKLSVSPSEWKLYLAKQRKPKVDPPRIRRILFDNNSALSDSVLAGRMDTKPGEILDTAKLTRDINRIHGIGSFSRVGVHVDRHGDQADLVIDAERKNWGPNYVRLGLSLTDDFDGSASYQFAVDYTMTELNELGGEWKVIAQIGEWRRLWTEFYQPLDASGDLFVSPQIGYDARPFNLFSGGSKIAELDVRGWTGALDVGTVFGDWGELRVGPHWHTGKSQVEFSTVPLDDIPFDDGALVARLSVDTLDLPTIPSRGVLGYVRFARGFGAIGSDDNYQVVDGRLSAVMAIDRTSIALLTRAGSTTEGNAPIYRSLTLGGFLQLSGLKPRELAGRHEAFAALAVYTRLAGSKDRTFGMPLYAGFSLEAGNVWQTKEEVRFDSLIPASSLFLGLDTPVGPLYLAYGYAEMGQTTLYLALGRIL